MKLKLRICMFALLLPLFFSACGTADTPSAGKTALRLGGLKGPTSMGLVKILEDNSNGETENDYAFEIAASADLLTPKLLQGELDIVAVPINVASVLYNKTQGGVKLLAVNMLGAIDIVEKGSERIHSIADLKGETIFATGKGTTPEYVLTYLLKQNGLDIEKDVTVEWKSEPTETVAALKTADHAVALLPQPYSAMAMAQVENLHLAVDLNEAWESLGTDSRLVTAGIIVRSEFAQEHPEAVASFMSDYRQSAEYVVSHVDEAAALIEKFDIVKADVARLALPKCPIVCMTGEEMQHAVSGYLNVLYEENPVSVGGVLPDDAFYQKME